MDMSASQVTTGEIVLRRSSEGRYLTTETMTEFIYSVQNLPEEYLVENGRRIIISYLPSSATADSLRKICGAVGDVVSANVVVNSNGLAAGYGFCTFAKSETASKAIDLLDGGSWEGKILRLDKVLRVTSSHKRRRKVIVRRFPCSWGIDGLRKHFENFGPLRRVKIIGSKEAAVGFVEFVLPSTAMFTTEHFRQLAPTSDAISLEYAYGKGRRQEVGPRVPARTWSIYLGNLSRRMTESYLTKIFEQYGHVHSLVIKRAGNNRGGGFGFLAMRSADEASEAIVNLNRSVHFGILLHASLQ